MKRSKYLFVLIALVALGAWGTAPSQEGSGPEPMRVSLENAIQEAFKNNKEIQISSFQPESRQFDITQQEAAFDSNLDSTFTYVDFTSPSPTSVGITDPNGATLFDSLSSGGRPLQRGTVIKREGTQASLRTTFTDPLRFGSSWIADLTLNRTNTSAINVGGQSFPPAFQETYYAGLTMSYLQPLLRNFGTSINETQIIIAAADQEIDNHTFRKQVQDTLQEVESAYWTLVFERQDLEVRKEALALAEELLRLNKIRVEVGTLPPIDITQAEAGVASREEAVIIAESNIENAEDRLRRVMGLDPQSPKWNRPVIPTEDLLILERELHLDIEVENAIQNRADLAQARLRLEQRDTSLAYQRNQMKYTLNVRADLSLEGLSGDDNPLPGSGFNLSGGSFQVDPALDEDIFDAMDVLSDTDFATYQASVTLGIPIGNRAAEAEYTKARLSREQSSIEYQNLEQMAIVEVNQAVRQVRTDRKRIDAAEKNRILQEKTVEAEQRKFENGLSTSFEVLQLQRDLAEARSSENAAKRDYRISLANLDLATGVLEQTRSVRVEDYKRDL